MFGYVTWKKAANDRLLQNSRIIETEKGSIQYAVAGKGGPAILLNAGMPGGYDQAMLVGADLAEKPYSLIGWSRPGYLGTPFPVGRTLDEQVDAECALMDALEIEKAAIHGASDGGPVSYTFAARYPERVWAVIGECVVSKYYNLYENPVSKFFGNHSRGLNALCVRYT
jgi:pimeloyl-ACP methyl ester carboxylesterase